MPDKQTVLGDEGDPLHDTLPHFDAEVGKLQSMKGKDLEAQVVLQPMGTDKSQGEREVGEDIQAVGHCLSSEQCGADTSTCLPVLGNDGVVQAEAVIGNLGTTFNIREQDPSPMVIDLEEGLIRPGLGPQNLELLGLQTEYIGLKEPSVALDYPSPFKGPANLEGISLSSKEIAKCRKACSKIMYGGRNKIKNSKGYREYRELYYVDYPDEEEELVCEGSQTLVAEEENSLVAEVSKSLSLKRMRPDLMLTDDNICEDDQGMSKKARGVMVEWRKADVDAQMEYVEYKLKAEEASQNKPHDLP